ncbi:hypothetical protein B0A55_09290 [Friedmanniomyces simplex]|uniref:NADP-dependent oxidoreductase domain-containing protein n=1 Tax=Friedmanniomyces simplex TaxID=329884 RepID=A0A4V5NDY5_9PEZI|nr:hypothetical protein B0A55_09290 [Friedmanniomyces simplex]
MSFFKPPPKPDNPLGWHRILSPTAAVKVSPICLGGISIGTGWEELFGKNEDPFKLIDAYYALGGNFIDTSNTYNFETSESMFGEWMESRGVRDQMVIATKYSAGYKAYDREKLPLQSNYTGNSAKSMHLSADIIHMAEDQENGDRTAAYGLTEKDVRVSEVLESIAETHKSTLHAVALAYLFAQSTYVIPIVGVQTVEHVKAMPDALRTELSPEEIRRVHEASPLVPQFPMNFLFSYGSNVPYNTHLTGADVSQSQMACWYDAPPKQPSYQPRE